MVHAPPMHESRIAAGHAQSAVVKLPTSCMPCSVKNSISPQPHRHHIGRHRHRPRSPNRHTRCCQCSSFATHCCWTIPSSCRLRTNMRSLYTRWNILISARDHLLVHLHDLQKLSRVDGMLLVCNAAACSRCGRRDHEFKFVFVFNWSICMYTLHSMWTLVL